MRRAEKEMRDPRAVEELLRAAPVGRLGTVGADGAPRIKPLNFVCAGRVIYFHTALAGEKVEDLRRDDRVCFEVDEAIAYVRAKDQPCQAGYLFRSVVARGRGRLVEDEGEKLRALQLLMEKYQGPGQYAFPPEKLRVTGVVRIDVEEATGKEHLGAGRVREEAERALADGRPLPLASERE